MTSTNLGDFTPGPLDRDATFYVAGHRGMVGSAIWRRLESAGFTDLRGASSSEVDLRDQKAHEIHMQHAIRGGRAERDIQAAKRL